MNTRTLKITKQTIIQALRTEPLHAGNWLSSDGCRACAVGATLRVAGVVAVGMSAFESSDRQRRLDFFGACGAATQGVCTPDERAAPGNWLGALSIVWEYLNMNKLPWEISEDLRPDIWAWAEDNIPEEYTTTVNVEVAS